MFLNALFYSLPLAILNSCYLASIVKSNKSSFLAWYSTSFFSAMSTREFFSSITASFANAYQTYKGMLHHMQPHVAAAATLTSTVDSIEQKSQFLYFLVSVFISVSVGICLYTTYYELMKQIHFMALLFSARNAKNSVSSSASGSQKDEDGFLLPASSQENNSTSDDDLKKLSSLGSIEILVYFCYKFCLITSRLAILALFWYLFNEWLLLAVLVHIFTCYLCTCFTSTINSTASSTKSSNSSPAKFISIFSTQKFLKEYKKLFKQNSSSGFGQASYEPSGSSNDKSSFLLSSSSKINQHLTLFIVCLLSFIDLFVNQLSEFYHLRKCIVYYMICFAQNISILTYWLVRTIINARREQEESIMNTKNLANQSGLLNILIKSTTSAEQESDFSAFFSTTSVIDIDSGIASSQPATGLIYSPTTYACYATLIYLCIILFTIFGLILKFLHLHILRKRYRKVCDEL